MNNTSIIETIRKESGDIKPKDVDNVEIIIKFLVAKYGIKEMIVLNPDSGIVDFIY